MRPKNSQASRRTGSCCCGCGSPLSGCFMRVSLSLSLVRRILAAARGCVNGVFATAGPLPVPKWCLFSDFQSRCILITYIDVIPVTAGHAAATTLHERSKRPAQLGGCAVDCLPSRLRHRLSVLFFGTSAARCVLTNLAGQERRHLIRREFLLECTKGLLCTQVSARALTWQFVGNVVVTSHEVWLRPRSAGFASTALDPVPNALRSLSLSRSLGGRNTSPRLSVCKFFVSKVCELHSNSLTPMRATPYCLVL